MRMMERRDRDGLRNLPTKEDQLKNGEGVRQSTGEGGGCPVLNFFGTVELVLTCVSHFYYHPARLVIDFTTTHVENDMS